VGTGIATELAPVACSTIPDPGQSVKRGTRTGVPSRPGRGEPFPGRADRPRAVRGDGLGRRLPLGWRGVLRAGGLPEPLDDDRLPGGIIGSSRRTARPF